MSLQFTFKVVFLLHVQLPVFCPSNSVLFCFRIFTSQSHLTQLKAFTHLQIKNEFLFLFSGILSVIPNINWLHLRNFLVYSQTFFLTFFYTYLAVCMRLLFCALDIIHCRSYTVACIEQYIPSLTYLNPSVLILH